MKIRAPEKVRKLLTDHWEKNKDKAALENWGKGVSTACLSILPFT